MKSDGSSIVVVFGRPGAGKTTISSMAIEAFENDQQTMMMMMMRSRKNFVLTGLDLDVCVPQWMKDNFSKGMYPTLKQRNEFAFECCKYVREKLAGGEADPAKPINNNATIISFSFVNDDLREIFRSNFPEATWVLVDTSEEEATRRIQSRQDHFYTGEASQSNTDNDEDRTISREQDHDPTNQDNSDWKFAAVTFEHEILDGKEAVEKNALKLIEIIKKLPMASA
ncbi:unnamed protein product [Cylindrotheca closterium]|uniref:Uncharacterized protein n=1 Tax=Cylindrotheca closterium TaxID=2856 RepID=A0AAD2FGQ3_9STRA|nr:unnamed protein product [Cylindrotheca closterium]